MNKPYFATFNYKIWIENDLIEVIYYTDTIDLEMVQLGVAERLKLAQGVSYPVFVNMQAVRYVTQEARQFLSQSPSTDLIAAGAFLVHNRLQQMLVNFFLLLDKPQIPTKYFSSEAKARQWLAKYHKQVPSACDKAAPHKIGIL